MKTDLKFYDELTKLEKIFYRLHLKKAIKVSGKELRKLCDVQLFLENNERGKNE